MDSEKIVKTIAEAQAELLSLDLEYANRDRKAEHQNTCSAP